MRKLRDGKYEVAVYLDTLSLGINGFDVMVRSVKCCHLIVEFYYEAEIKASEYEPPSREWFDLLSVAMESTTILTNNAGVVLSLDSRADILPLLSDKQVDRLTDLLTETDGTKERHL